MSPAEHFFQKFSFFSQKSPRILQAREDSKLTTVRTIQPARHHILLLTCYNQLLIASENDRLQLFNATDNHMITFKRQQSFRLYMWSFHSRGIRILCSLCRCRTERNVCLTNVDNVLIIRLLLIINLLV